jgi:hypothetical protein
MTTSQLPRQFGEEEPVVFVGDMAPETLQVFLQWSTKYGVRRIGIPWAGCLVDRQAAASPKALVMAGYPGVG